LFADLAAQAQCAAPQIAKLVANDGQANDEFGYSVGIYGTDAVVGAYGDADNGSYAGAAYLIDTVSGQQLKLLPDDGQADALFGHSVAINGNTVIVGAPYDEENGLNTGSAYLFDATTGKQIAKLLANDGNHADQFGHFVTVKDGLAIVGAASGISRTGAVPNIGLARNN
jgi:hypothetical protein